MAQRRFGPTLGAGVVVIEKEAERLIDPAPLGVTLYVTPMAKGNPAKCISTFSSKDMLRKAGGRIASFDGMDCANDFWDHSVGAGELHLLRVATVAQLRSAGVQLWSREMTVNVDQYASTDGKSRAVMQVNAKSGGRWGGRKRTIWRTVPTSVAADVGTITLTTGLTMLLDEWVGGYIQFDGVPSKQYAITGNTTGGVVSVSSDATMLADFAGGVDTGFQLILGTETNADGTVRGVTVQIGDGEQNPSTEFSLTVYVDESKVRYYADLSMDPAHKRYFVRLINDDQSNEDITVTDLLTPGNPAPTDRRPANHAGVSSAITATTLTAKIFQVRRLVGTSNPTFAFSGDTALMMYDDTLEFTCTVVALGNATFTLTSKRLGGSAGLSIHAAVVAANTAAQAFAFNAMTCPLLPTITMTCGSTVFVVGDKFQFDWMPLTPSGLVGGTLTPDFINKPYARFRITANDHKIITVQSGDLTVEGGGAVGDRWEVFAPSKLGGSDVLAGTVMNGYDATAALTDADYTTTQLNPLTSPARRLLAENKGLVKVATPDRTATAVQRQGLAFAEALNWQYRVEIPDTVTAENDAVEYINTTIGRNDFGVTSWPSYADVMDPERPGMLKRTPMTGMIHGREALIAKTYQGYHKAAAGIEVTLPKVVLLPTGDLTINEEVTNPQGVNVIKKVKGNFVIWGDRSIAIDTAWKFKHHRELMSHYENRLREGFDYIIFSLNDKRTWAQLLTTLKAFFLPEFTKGAIRGNKFTDAASIKIDSENNTDATAADGDLNCDISLRLADTIERFNINIGKAGIFDNVSL